MQICIILLKLCSAPIFRKLLWWICIPESYIVVHDLCSLLPSTVHRIDILGQLGGTPNYMLSPPKEDLVEKVISVVVCNLTCLFNSSMKYMSDICYFSSVHATISNCTKFQNMLPLVYANSVYAPLVSSPTKSQFSCWIAGRGQVMSNLYLP